MRKQLNVTGRGGIRGQDSRERKVILEQARDIEFRDEMIQELEEMILF
jgi:hypothetical protein